jgi:hypothetical protein
MVEWTEQDRERLVRVETKMDAFKEYVESRIKSIETSTDLASKSLDKRLDNMNEFRAQLKDQAAQLLPRAEFDIQHCKIVDDINLLKQFKAVTDNKADRSDFHVSTVIAISALVVGVISMVIVVL